MTGATWNPERIEQLRNFVVAGLTCSQIAAEIGVSRNAVIGKIHRLGLGSGRPERAPARACPPSSRRSPFSPQRQLLRLLHANAAGTAVTPRPYQSTARNVARCSSWRRGNAAGQSAIPAPRISHFAETRRPRASPTARATPVWRIGCRRGGAHKTSGRPCGKRAQQFGASSLRLVWRFRSPASFLPRTRRADF